jgi:hypothetical protein
MDTSSTTTADRARIADIDAQILAHQPGNALTLLKTERECIQQRLDSYKYPILTLPYEITSEIFVHFLPVPPLFPPTRGILSPAVFTLVCRTWREIALTTPALWSAISVSKAEMMSADCLHTWLARSRSHPLSIRIDEGFDESKSFTQFLEAIAAHSARWKHLDATIPPSDLAFFTGAMESLCTLALQLRSGRTAPTDLVAFAEVPRLRTATLCYSAASAVRLPWAQLTSLTLNTLLPAEYSTILKQAINLVYCNLDIYDDGDNETHPGDVTLRRLETLVLAEADILHHEPVAYLDLFILPALRRLQLPELFLGPQPLHNLRSFISRSQCTLQEVRVTYPKPTSNVAYRTEFPSIPSFLMGPHPEESSDDSDGESE